MPRHEMPDWRAFLDDDGAIVFNTGESTVKGRNIRRDPRVSVCVQDEHPPFAFVSVDGVAGVAAELLVRVRATNVVALERISD